MVIEHDLQGRHQVVVILQGFTHPHHHHIGDDALIGVACTECFSEGMLSKP